MEVVRKKC